ncbi:MAG: NAD(+)/NADH kinase, partial [Treponema sp.]|nr:NAD(+)/NADH kinase [Treponema sp.]
VECVLVLGGDGTLLQASRDLLDTGLPLLGLLRQAPGKIKTPKDLNF